MGAEDDITTYDGVADDGVAGNVVATTSLTTTTAPRRCDGCSIAYFLVESDSIITKYYWWFGPQTQSHLPQPRMFGIDELAGIHKPYGQGWV